MFPNPLIIPIGMAVGIVVAAPVGPVNVLCIQRALARGMAGGVAAGLGAVLGDGLIAFSAAMGITAVSSLMDSYRIPFLIVGGLVLLAFGIKLAMTEPKEVVTSGNGDAHPPLRAYLMDIAKTFFLTVTNPGAVLGLFAIFGGIGTFVEIGGVGEALLMVLAIMAGSLLWWIGLSYVVSHFRSKFDLHRLQRVNQIAGLALVVLALVLFGEVVVEAAGLGSFSGTAS